MILGKIAGTVVSSKISVDIEGGRYLLVEKCDHHGAVKGDFVVALDLVGANSGEMVLLTEGSPARETPSTVNKPLDALVVGIVDMIDENDKVVYKK
jgi:carbon dioxide concentrating mechanism protein CcmL